MSDTPHQDLEHSSDEPTRDVNTTDATPTAPQAKSAQLLRPLRIWPAVILLLILWALRLAPGLADEPLVWVMMMGFMGPTVCGFLIVLWWLLLSRATMMEKLLGVVGLVAIVAATTMLADKSIRGFGTLFFVVPCGMTTFTATLVLLARLPSTQRTWIALLAALLGFGFWDAIRNDGVWGDFRSSLAWRWQPTAEDRYLATLASRSETNGPSEHRLAQQSLAQPEWPSFRGPRRDGVQPGIALHEDWDSKSLEQVWRRPVGPGWSSFSVAGIRLFTQEQRGENEAVICLDAETGSEVWAHQYESRFWEAVGGAGPRATPTLSGGALFALGAEGLLFRIDPITGDELWKRDLREDASREPPTWGFASSPLVVDDLVIVHAGGEGDSGVLAYDFHTGEPRWKAPAGDHSYSSPQLSTIADNPCVLMLTNKGLTFINPIDGKVIGDHEWEYEGYRVVQPLRAEPASFLIGTAMGTGTQRIDITLEDDQFSAKERWTSRKMSPSYNDYVAHKGFLYGFDNNIFACVDLETGHRKWKKGRYGNGQVLLLPDADQLLVISELGELVLLRATPEKLVELARGKVLAGKTWNHPVLVGDRLYVRNGEEAACFTVPTRQL